MTRVKSRYDDPTCLAQVEDAAAELLPGERKTGVLCPFCGGGRTRERTLGISKDEDGLVFFRCFRVSCGIQGRTRSSVRGWAGDPTTKRREPKKEIQRLDLSLLQGVGGSLWDERLRRLYDLGTNEYDRLGWRVLDKGRDTERLAIPVRGRESDLRGYEVKAFDTRYGPKSRLIHAPTSPEAPLWGSYISPQVPPLVRRPLVVVEDSISALKVSRHTDSYCLLGTDVSTDKGLELADISGDRPIYLCLDKDASEKAAIVTRKMRFLLPNLRNVPIMRDLKFYTDQEILNLIEN